MRPESLTMYNVSTGKGRRMSQAGEDPKRLQRATAQPGGHAVVVGKALKKKKNSFVKKYLFKCIILFTSGTSHIMFSSIFYFFL